MPKSLSQPLARLLQSQGFGSRKACEALVHAGAVALDGVMCRDPKATVAPRAGLIITVEGQDWPWLPHLYLALHKPPDYECSQAPTHHPSVLSLLPAPYRARGVQPVGRLDADTTGLLLLSDDGAFIHALTSPRRHVPKTYRVTVRHALTADMLAALQAGVVLHDAPEPVRALEVQLLDDHQLTLVIDQGRYHQVKRMLAAVGNRVEALHRVAMGSLRLDTPPLDALQPGEWRVLDTVAVQLAYGHAASVVPAAAGKTHAAAGLSAD
jgi:16S rRNA pseudouridine516 synthase